MKKNLIRQKKETIKTACGPVFASCDKTPNVAMFCFTFHLSENQSWVNKAASQRVELTPGWDFFRGITLCGEIDLLTSDLQ